MNDYEHNPWPDDPDYEAAINIPPAPMQAVAARYRAELQAERALADDLAADLNRVTDALNAWFGHVDNNDIARSMDAAEVLKALRAESESLARYREARQR